MKKPLPPRSKEQESREINESTIGPNSGYMVPDGKPKGFFYLDHRTVDGRANIITDVHVTPGNVHQVQKTQPVRNKQTPRPKTAGFVSYLRGQMPSLLFLSNLPSEGRTC